MRCLFVLLKACIEANTSVFLNCCNSLLLMHQWHMLMIHCFFCFLTFQNSRNDAKRKAYESWKPCWSIFIWTVISLYLLRRFSVAFSKIKANKKMICDQAEKTPNVKNWTQAAGFSWGKKRHTLLFIICVATIWNINAMVIKIIMIWPSNQRAFAHTAFFKCVQHPFLLHTSVNQVYVLAPVKNVFYFL